MPLLKNTCLARLCILAYMIASSGYLARAQTAPSTQGAGQNKKPTMIIKVQSETMLNVVIRLRSEYGIKICFEELDLDQQKEGITFNQLVTKLKKIRTERSLSAKEAAILASSEKSLAGGLNGDSIADIKYPEISGTFMADTADELLNQLIANTKYSFIKSNSIYIIAPRNSSVLSFPISMHTAGTSLEEAAKTLLAQQPSPATIGLFFTGAKEIDNAKVGELLLDRVDAREALCRLVESSDVRCCWTLAGFQGGRFLAFVPVPQVSARNSDSKTKGDH